MSSFEENVDLKPFNTFHLSASARHFVTVGTLSEIQKVIQSPLFRDNKTLILGGGSNILLTGDFAGLVIKNELKGISILKEDDDRITLKVGSGENWHAFVMHCVDNGWGGIENLSLIPGTVGAAPMQNIGAYGVEIRNTLVSVDTVDLSDGSTRVFSNDDCRFGYRESIFKNELKNKYFISSVTLRLTKRNHSINIRYGAIREILQQHQTGPVTIKAVSEAVIHIRRSKLPDPDVIGNAGSFFKNPSINAEKYDSLKNEYSDMPSFPGEDGLIKVPAGWLIEQCGWKGKSFDHIGVHKDQALVLVNYGGGSGDQLWDLAMRIRESVNQKFGIILNPEVNVITT